jgi:hypothetical protein
VYKISVQALHSKVLDNPPINELPVLYLGWIIVRNPTHELRLEHTGERGGGSHCISYLRALINGLFAVEVRNCRFVLEEDLARILAAGFQIGRVDQQNRALREVRKGSGPEKCAAKVVAIHFSVTRPRYDPFAHNAGEAHDVIGKSRA